MAYGILLDTMVWCEMLQFCFQIILYKKGERRQKFKARSDFVGAQEYKQYRQRGGLE